MSEQITPAGNTKCNTCFSFLYASEADAPTDCLGLASEDFVKHSSNDEGYVVQVCPREKWLGDYATAINFCGNGPDVLVLHQEGAPNDLEQVIVQHMDMF